MHDDFDPGRNRPNGRTARWRPLAFWIGFTIFAMWAGGAVVYFLTAKGTVRIAVAPQDAAVRLRIDGRPYAIRGPEDAISLGWGRHECTVEADGYAPVVAKIEAPFGKSNVVHIDLQPEPVTTPSEAASGARAVGMPRRVVNPQDQSVLVLVPAGPYLASPVGITQQGWALLPIDLPAYYIGLTEVTNAQYKRFVDATGHRPPDHADFGAPAWREGTFSAELADHPATCLSWDDAAAYCRWAGLRLPSELEWEKAACGLDGFEFPWGNTWDKDRCRKAVGGRERGTCRVTDFPAGRSLWGAYNMAGNVWEWCADWFEAQAYDRYRRGDLAPPALGDRRITRGGSYDEGNSGSFSNGNRAALPPATRAANTGFRVARDATP